MNDTDLLQTYLKAFDSTEGLVYLLDKDGNLMNCNHNLLRFLDVDSIQGDSIYEMLQEQGLWNSEQIRGFQQNDMDCLSTGERSKEEQAVINHNGAIHYFELSRIPLADESGYALGLVVILHDLTKQKLLNHQLKAQRRKNQPDTESAFSAKYRDLSKLKILLIEDNLLAQKAEKTILLNCRCLTDIAASPRQANEIFKPGKYDMVLMDLTLEDGNGYQVTTMLRKREQGSHHRVPIIALTGHDPSIVGLNCEDAEMDGIMRKPLTIEQANQLIQRFVRHADVSVKGLREFKH